MRKLPLIKNILLILSFWVSMPRICQAQNVQIDYNSFIYCLQSGLDSIEKYQVIELQIISDERAYLWLDDRDISGLSDERKIASFFWRVKGDLSLGHALPEYAVSEPIVFIDFIKTIVPYKPFTMVFLYKIGNTTDILSEDTVMNLIKKHMVVLACEKIQILGIDRICYQQDFICIDWHKMTQRLKEGWINGGKFMFQQ